MPFSIAPSAKPLLDEAMRIQINARHRKSLRRTINDVLAKHLEQHLPSEELQVTDMMHEIAHSIVDVITAHPEEDQAALLALLMTFVGEEYFQRHADRER
jgi:hypothetical protein